jgi:archaellum component FlaC
MKLTIGNDKGQVTSKINAVLLSLGDDYKMPNSVGFFVDKIASLKEQIEKTKESIESKESTLKNLKKRVENL